MALSLVVYLPFLIVVALAAVAAAASLLSRRGGLLLACLFTVGVLVGMARGVLPDANSSSIPIGSLAGREAALEGVVRDDPSRRGQLVRVRLTLDHAQLRDQTELGAFGVAGDAIAWVYPPPYELGTGDRVTLTGVPQRPVPDGDDENAAAGQEQATVSFRDDLVILMRPQLRIVGRAPPPMLLINSVRDSLSASLERNLPSPQAELARALLLGQRDDLPSELSDEWRRAGTAHLLAISGLHVSVVLGVALVTGVMVLGRRLGLFVLLPLGIIWAYAILSGLNPPVVRAAIMGSVYLGAIASGRQPSGGLALVLAATVIALWDPKVMATASFQMTVAAMAGIVFLTDPLRRVMGTPFGGDISNPGASLADSWQRVGITGISASLGAVIGIKPLLLHYFGATSLFTIPASLLGTAALPAVLLASAATGMVGVFADGALASATAWAAWPFLTFLLGLSSVFSSPTFAAITIAPLSAEAVILIYLVIGGLFLIPLLRSPSGLLGPMVSLPSISMPSGRRILTSWPIVGGLVIVTAAAGIGAAAPYISHEEQLTVHVLDVGQGDSILIESPTGRRVLIDGGPDGALLQRRLAEHLPWWSRRIDVVILTHPSADHLIGLTETLGRYDVGFVMDPQLESGTVYGRQWAAALKESTDLTVVRAERGTTLDLGGGAHLELVHPPPDRPFDAATEHDDNSVVAKLSYEDVSFLFAADIYRPGEEFLLDSGVDLHATVLKVAHQGSRYSSSEEFLEAVSPRVAVITAGEGNRFGHPHPETIERLESLPSAPTILRTDMHGTVTLTTDGRTLSWDAG
ncbi:MAG: ComEC/Rec2 family competence protein [Chloroflexi bacterium]|nr:ComEC/Rec2 family competence protein [Chloroflexota bacterium]